MAQLDRQGALHLANAFGFSLNCDFHALDSAAVSAVIAAADFRQYRRPVNANGSRARYFHAYLRRAADRKESLSW